MYPRYDAYPAGGGVLSPVYLEKAVVLRPDIAKLYSIDGPAGGKKHIARLLAKMGILYLDTGAMYRAMALRY